MEMLHAKTPVTVKDHALEVLANASMDIQAQVARLHAILNVSDAQQLNVLSASQVSILKTDNASHAQLNAQHAKQLMIALVVSAKTHFTLLLLLMEKEFANQFVELDAKSVMSPMDVSHQMTENASITTEALLIAVETVRFALLLDVVNAKNAKPTTS